MKFLQRLVAEKSLSLGWNFSPEDDHNLIRFKALMFDYAAAARVPKVVDACRDLFLRYVKGESTAINPNIRSTVFGTALKYGGQEEWDELYKIYLKTENIDEKVTALKALGEAPASVRQQTLELMLSDSVKGQDIFYPVVLMGKTADGVEDMWKFFTSNYDAIYKKVPDAGTMIQHIVKIFTKNFTSLEQKKTVMEFFSKKDTSRFKLAFDQCLETITSNANIVARDRADIENFLTENKFI